ncbi:MAG: hypothetical protein WHS77_10045 [Brevinematales bacterium]
MSCKYFFIIFFLFFLFGCVEIKNKDRLTKKYDDFEIIKTEIISNSFTYINSNKKELVNMGIFCLFYSGKDFSKGIEITNVFNESYAAYLFLLKNIEERILDDSVIVELLPDKFMKTKNKKYFNFIVNKYKRAKSFDDKIKIIHSMTGVNEHNIEKFFKQEMEYFGKVIYIDFTNTIYNLSLKQEQQLLSELLDYFASLSSPIFFTNFYQMFVNSAYITNDFELYQGITRLLTSLSRNNSICLSDSLIQNEVWKNFKGEHNQFIIKFFIFAITTNSTFKVNLLSELKDMTFLPDEGKMFLLEMGGNLEAISNKLYSYDVKIIMERLNFFKFTLLNNIELTKFVENYIINEDYKNFVKNEIELVNLENNYIYQDICNLIFVSVLRNKDRLKDHIYFFDSLRKKQKSFDKKARLDLFTIKLIWLVENGYFEY